MIGRTAVLSRRMGVIPRRSMSGGGDVYHIAGRSFSTEQVVMGIIGIYGSLIFLGTRGGGKKEEAAVSSGVVSSSTAVVSMMDDGFDAWAKVPGNMDKWVASFEK